MITFDSFNGLNIPSLPQLSANFAIEDWEVTSRQGIHPPLEDLSEGWRGPDSTVLNSGE